MVDGTLSSGFDYSAARAMRAASFTLQRPQTTSERNLSTATERKTKASQRDSRTPGWYEMRAQLRPPRRAGGGSTPGNQAYRIGPLDVLDISVFQAPGLTKTVEVADNGTINLPLLGETPAAGKTAQELERDLNSKLGAKYLQNPQVTVKVKEFNSSRVTVTGAVKNPGVFPYKGETLLQFVTMAGGLAPESNSMVLVLRQNNGKTLGREV